MVNKPAKSHSAIVKILESMGAVPYVKTNVPQALMVCWTSLPQNEKFHDFDFPRWQTHTTISSVSLPMLSITNSFLVEAPAARALSLAVVVVFSALEQI